MDDPKKPVTPETKTTPITTPSSVPLEKEKHSRAFSFVSTLFLLSLLAVGVMTYLWYYQKQQAISYQADNSAVNSEKASLQAQIDKLKKQNANLGNAVVDQAANGAMTDDEQIIAATKAYSHGQTSIGNASVSVVIHKKQDNFARAGVTVNNQYGFSCILKKADDTWMVLYCTQSETETTKQLNQQFGVPSTVIAS